MADPGARVAAPIRRAQAKFPGAPEDQENYTPPTAREPRQQRQQRGRPMPEATDEELAQAARNTTPSEKREIPHWELTIADLEQQREAIETAIQALRALYR